MAKSASPKNNRFPNAPLAEVVFELRWALVGEASLPLPLHSDPGPIPTLATFTVEAAKLGFKTTRDMSRPQETGAYGIARRYLRAADEAFPYFKKQTLDGIRALLDSYPNLPGYPLRPTHIELRYIDVFDKSLLGTIDLFKFAAMGTTLNVQLPPILDSGLFETGLSGRLVL